MRVLVFGNSGSGKSTLAERLAHEHALVHLDLDSIVWEPGEGATRRSPEDIAQSLDTFLAAGVGRRRHDRSRSSGASAGFLGPRAQALIVERFAVLPLLQPDREDHIGAAALRNRCRRGGVQIGTIDALLAQLCIRHDLMLLTTDRDFAHAAGHCPLRVWSCRK